MISLPYGASKCRPNKLTFYFLLMSSCSYLVIIITRSDTIVGTIERKLYFIFLRLYKDERIDTKN